MQRCLGHIVYSEAGEGLFRNKPNGAIARCCVVLEVYVELFACDFAIDVNKDIIQGIVSAVSSMVKSSIQAWTGRR